MCFFPFRFDLSICYARAGKAKEEGYNNMCSYPLERFLYVDVNPSVRPSRCLSSFKLCAELIGPPDHVLWHGNQDPYSVEFKTLL